jgi:hypothetical protein
MDKDEAKSVLEQEIEALRQRPYEELVELIDDPRHYELQAPSGRTYYLERNVFWEHRRSDDVRVSVSIDDGGGKAFHPLSMDFIKSPDGSVVG